jgi:FemAB-related protein (PEP-CTERM system-associated)
MSGALAVRTLSPRDAATAQRWDDFVAGCPQATFFHRAGWQTVLREAFDHATHFLYAEAGGGIEGVLPLVHIRSRLFGHALVSLPFAAYGGVAANGEAAADALESEAQALAQRLGVAHLELRNREVRHADWPTSDLYVTFRKALSADADANLAAIPRKQRAMVRKGIAGGLSSRIDTDLERFFPLYAGNQHRHGTPALPKRYFAALQRAFGADVEVLTVSAPDGRALSSVLSFHFRDEVLPYHAGDSVEARALAANDYKYWALMQRAGERGARIFDFGRSKRGTGAFAFKRHWGFEPTPLHYEYRLYRRDAVPQNNPSNAKFGLLIAAWRRLPLGLATWLGPYVVRNLG